MKWTREPPKKAGHYWWTNFSEHTPTILEVRKYNGRLYAEDIEYSFEVPKKPSEPTPFEDYLDEGEDPEDYATVFGGEKFYMGESLWCEISRPELNGEIIEGEF